MYSIFQEKNSFAAVTAFYAVSLSEFHMSAHSHDSCEIMYVTDGSCKIWCEQEEMTLLKNQFIFIDAKVPHRLFIEPGRPCGILNIEFLCGEKETPADLGILRKNSPDFRGFSQNAVSYVRGNDLRSFGYSLKDLISYLQKESDAEDYLFNLLFQRMLLELSYCVKQNKKSRGIAYLKKACGYIEEHLLSDMKIPEIAEYTGINKSYLQQLFSGFLHCTITEYINRKRMEQAEFLLTNSTMSVTDIAFSTGYNSRQHFGHTFEKYYGMCPKKYRKLHMRTLVPDTKENQYVLENGCRVECLQLGKREE
ncbi:MAG: helix-turn-helix transcriptional regulator [Clostridiales bacterium]|nr:helix-turn-helix transcriptional regulator [Clostridiales bacterium]